MIAVCVSVSAFGFVDPALDAADPGMGVGPESGAPLQRASLNICTAPQLNPRSLCYFRLRLADTLAQMASETQGSEQDQAHFV